MFLWDLKFLKSRLRFRKRKIILKKRKKNRSFFFLTIFVAINGRRPIHFIRTRIILFCWSFSKNLVYFVLPSPKDKSSNGSRYYYIMNSGSIEYYVFPSKSVFMLLYCFLFFSKNYIYKNIKHYLWFLLLNVSFSRLNYTSHALIFIHKIHLRLNFFKFPITYKALRYFDFEIWRITVKAQLPQFIYFS